MFAHYPLHPSVAIRTAWLLLSRSHPSLVRIFFALVFPLSLLPPAMIYYAGTYHGDQFMVGFSGRDWVSIALLFLGAELATVTAMGPAIHWIAELQEIQADKAGAVLLAFFAPIPLWLCSLSLFVPSFLFCMLMCCLGLLAACLIIYHGTAVLLKCRDEAKTTAISYGIMAAGLIAWALLLLIVIPIG